MKNSILIVLFLLIYTLGKAQDDFRPTIKPRPWKWQIEPIKLTSLMVNTHPEYNGWGLEVGRKLSKKIWLTTMIEKTMGSDFADNFNPDYDYLMSFNYFAWLTTGRYYFKNDDAIFTFFADAGIVYQSARHKYLSGEEIFEEKANSFGPLGMIGFEWRFFEGFYLKYRFGAFANVYHSGDMESRIEDGQDQPSYYLYPHLTDAVLKSGNYAGDVALGIKF